MDARQQKHTLLSDVQAPARKQVSVQRVLASEPRFIATPQHRPQQYASDIISPVRHASDSSYARFYRKAVAAAERTVKEPAPEHSLAHQAVLQARPVTPVTRPDLAVPRKKKVAKKRAKIVRRTANILVAASIILSGVMGFMVYRYHVALQKVEALPLQTATNDVTSDVSPTPTDAAGPAQLNETKPAAVASKPVKLAPGSPYTISIPKLKVSASIISVGLTKKGAMSVPGNIWQVGWDKTSAKPADNSGVVIMNGHVHGPTQPGVFANLTKLKPGDQIIVKDIEGVSYTYKVDSSQTFKAGEAEGSLQQSASPTKQGLNLVTCTGDIKGDEYQSRLVVFAERV